MELLPDEMVLHVMSFLEPQELLEAAARVCTRWQDLALNVALWSAAAGYCYHTPGSRVLSAARAGAASSQDDATTSAIGCAEEGRALRTLSVRGRADAAELVLGAWSGCAALQRLDLHACRLPPDALRRLADAFPGLRALSLHDSGPPGAALDYEPLARFRLLAALDVSLCKELPAGTVGAVARACEALEELRCAWAALVTDDDVRQLVELRGPRLRALVLGGEALSDDAYARLAHCTRLRELGLAPCGAGSDEALLRGVAPLAELRALQLTDAGALSNAGLLALLERLAAARRLRSFALAWCPAADDAALELLANRCLELERVSLRQLPALRDRGVAALLRACPRLTHLSLVWNDAITGRHFLPLLSELAPRLRHLDLGYCDNIPKEAVDALMQRRRDLKVTRPEVWCRPRKTAHACCERWTSS